MNSILITGAAGFIGSRLAAHFESAGVRVVRDTARTRVSGGHAVIDAANLERAMEGRRPDAILHAAGSGTVAQVVDDPVRHMPANLAATLGVLEYARSHAPGTGVRFSVERSRLWKCAGAAAAGKRCSGAGFPLRREQGTVGTVAGALCEESSLAHDGSPAFLLVYGPGLRKQLLWDAMTKFSMGQCDFFGTELERERDWVHVDDVCRFVGDCWRRGARTVSRYTTAAAKRPAPRRYSPISRRASLRCRRSSPARRVSAIR